MAKYLKCDQCGAFKSMTAGSYEFPPDGWITMSIWHAVGRPNGHQEFCSTACALTYLTSAAPTPEPAPEPQAV